MEIRDLIKEFCKTRPESSIIIGYGSEVKKQANDNGLDRQVDLILGVEDSREWHKLNLEMNPTDYGSKIGYQLLPIYENLGTKINYLSYLPFEGYMFKIGVINTRDLICDLIYWRNFFVAGRLQKPVEIVKSSSEVDYAIKINQMNALKTALLALNKQETSIEELFNMICSLSYIGDLRRIMHVETKHKINNIVNGSFQEFKELYSKVNDGYYEIDANGNVTINYERILHEIDSLPEPLKNKITNQVLNKKIDSELLLTLKQYILKYFIGINIRTSTAQPLKGCFLNGFSKTITYLNQKIGKKQ